MITGAKPKGGYHGKTEGSGGVFQPTPRPTRRARVAEQAWGVDISREFLKLIRKRYVVRCKYGVGPPSGRLLGLEMQLRPNSLL